MRCDTEIAIRNILIRSYADKIKYKNKNGYNTVRITAGIPEKQLTLINGPAIFFSIVCCVSQLAEFSDPGRVSIKVAVGYAFTKIAAILVGISVFNAVKPGTLDCCLNLSAIWLR